MDRIKQDLVFNEELLNESFYKLFEEYNTILHTFRWNLIAFAWWLITFLFFFTKEIQNKWYLENIIIISLLITFISSIFLSIIFPILHLNINLYRIKLYNKFIPTIKKYKDIITYNQNNFTKDNIEDYKKKTFEFQNKNKHLPWYYRLFTTIENTFIIIFILSLIILLISLFIYFVK